ncbi:hypothetical protein [Microbacterium sp. SZ1]|uniref:hypothetical protein n=1 Tax=Microbacterium sp. SZ1 TaxID=1849736 RepID=UPI00117C194A|nr:hypothetical protein [Microbacterium sp. SZ1]
MWIAATGNLTIVLAAVMASTPPVSLPIATVFEFLFPFVSGLFSPELLIFTTLISVLSGLGLTRENTGELREAARLIAWAVRVALALVLSFVVVVVVVDPHVLPEVLFALLLGFVTFVLAERLDPPAALSAEAESDQRVRDLRSRQLWARSALGARWTPVSARRAWWGFAALATAPVAVQALLGVVLAIAVKGGAFGLSPHWWPVPLLAGYGSIIYSLAWLSTADKAESPQARAWRGWAFATIGVLANAAFAYTFFGVVDFALMGWLVIVISTLHGVALLFRWPKFYRVALDAVSSSLTARHLTRAEQRLAAATTDGENSPGISPRRETGD